MGTVGIPNVSISASSAPDSMQMPPSLNPLKGVIVTPSGAFGNGGKVMYGPSTGLTKFSTDGSGMNGGVVTGSAAILKEGFYSDARHLTLVVCTCCSMFN